MHTVTINGKKYVEEKSVKPKQNSKTTVGQTGKKASTTAKTKTATTRTQTGTKTSTKKGATKR